MVKYISIPLIKASIKRSLLFVPCRLCLLEFFPLIRINTYSHILAMFIPGTVRVSTPRPGPHSDPGLCPDLL